MSQVPAVPVQTCLTECLKLCNQVKTDSSANGFPLLTGIQFFPVLHASVSRVLKPETLPAFCRVKTDLTCVALKALTDPSTAQKKLDMLFM